MAGDWIKFETTTPDKPEVVGIAAKLKIDQDAVTGKLARIWIWADQNSIDGEAVPVTDEFLDSLTRKRGFAAAMRHVGWLAGESGKLTFPGFERHNGKTAKARADSNRRMKKSRAGRESGCGNVAEKAQQKAQPEKSIENIASSKEDAGGGSGISQQALELCQAHPKRDMSQPALRAAQGAIKRHGFDKVMEGTRGYATATLQWDPNERLKFIKNATEFFTEDLWNQPGANWPSRANSKPQSRRTIDVGNRESSGLFTAHLESQAKASA